MKKKGQPFAKAKAKARAKARKKGKASTVKKTIAAAKTARTGRFSGARRLFASAELVKDQALDRKPLKNVRVQRTASEDPRAEIAAYVQYAGGDYHLHVLGIRQATWRSKRYPYFNKAIDHACAEINKKSLSKATNV